MNDEELIKENMMLDYSQLVMNNVYCHKEIERLNGALQTHEILLKSNVLEIERLNNIINELEKWLKERYDICKKNIDKMEYNEYSHNFYQVANNVNADRKDTLNKLQELKGSNNNE